MKQMAKPFYAYLAPLVPHDDPRSAEPPFHALYDPDRFPLSPAFLPLHPLKNGEVTTLLKQEMGNVCRPVYADSAQSKSCRAVAPKS